MKSIVVSYTSEEINRFLMMQSAKCKKEILAIAELSESLEDFQKTLIDWEPTLHGFTEEKVK